MIVNVTFRVFTVVPAVAFKVTVVLPTAAVLVAEKVTVVLPLPGAGKVAGAKVAVTPAGRPWAENVTF